MAIALNSVAFLIAVLCAGLMGYAIQRGTACTVATVDEIVTQRSCRRPASLVEAVLWVAGGLLIARALHVLPTLPAGYAVTLWTVVGGVLLGLGTNVNGACVIGAVARLGSGEWAYAATPSGFYLGCISVAAVFGTPAPRTLAQESPLLQGSAWTALVFAAFMAWRLTTPWRRTRPRR
jgi:toxin CptA